VRSSSGSIVADVRTYSPAEVAARSGFSIKTLRYYERDSILPPIARTAGGRRVYSDGDLATLGFLRCLRDTGQSTVSDPSRQVSKAEW
jgi:hypothetical protein